MGVDRGPGAVSGAGSSSSRSPWRSRPGAAAWPYWPARCGGLLSEPLTTTSTGECVASSRTPASSTAGSPTSCKAFDDANTVVADSPGPGTSRSRCSPRCPCPRDGTPAAISLDPGALEPRGCPDRAASGQRHARLRIGVQRRGCRWSSRTRAAGRSTTTPSPTTSSPRATTRTRWSPSSGSAPASRARSLRPRPFSARGVPMVSAIASADDFISRDVPGLHSVSPSNTEYAQALRTFLDGQVVLNSGIIVADQNPRPVHGIVAHGVHQRAPSRTSSTPTSRSTEAPSRPEPHPRSSPPSSPTSASPRSPRSPVDRLDMVFYAGRVADFRSFVEALNGRRLQVAAAGRPRRRDRLRRRTPLRVAHRRGEFDGRVRDLGGRAHVGRRPRPGSG